MHAYSRAKRLSLQLYCENVTGSVFFFSGIFQEQISFFVRATSITITVTAKTSTTTYQEIKSMMFSAFLWIKWIVLHRYLHVRIESSEFYRLEYLLLYVLCIDATELDWFLRESAYQHGLSIIRISILYFTWQCYCL